MSVTVKQKKATWSSTDVEGNIVLLLKVSGGWLVQRGSDMYHFTNTVAAIERFNLLTNGEYST